MSSLQFGTSGLRGLVTDLLGVPAYTYVGAFCRMLIEDEAFGPDRAVMIGRDLRASSPEIAATVLQSVRDCGLKPLDCGAIPTPALALAALSAGAPAIMVTGSHIPEDRNGLKFYRREGEITKADEARIIDHHAKVTIPATLSTTVNADHHDALGAYRKRYTAFFGTQALRGLTVGVYQHSSVGRDVICDVLTELGAVALPLGRAQTFIPVDTEALRPEDVALAKQWAKENSLDAIVSTDGDADRPLVADENGHFLRGDLVGALTAKVLHADVIATPVTSNSALEKLAIFRQVIRTKVGSPFVIAAMLEAAKAGARSVVGFEANGGVMLGSDVTEDSHLLTALPTRDAMLPILACLVMVAQTRTPLSMIAAQMDFSIALSNRLQNIPQAKTKLLLDKLGRDQAFRDTAFSSRGGVKDLNHSDGLRMTLGEGSILHFRASGNAPELRVYVEAGNQDDADALLEEGLTFASRETRDL